MSLDTALTTNGVGKEQSKVALGSIVSEKSEQLEKVEKRYLHKGICPHYDDCQHLSKAPNYYCLESRWGLIMRGQIICYLAPEHKENKQ